MSTQAIAWAVGPHPITPTEQLVLVLIAHHYSEVTKVCWPSQSTLVAESKLSRASINNAVKRLCDLGLVQKSTTTGSSTRYRLPQYTADLSTAWTSPVHPVDITCPPHGHKQQQEQQKEEQTKAAAVAATGTGEKTMKLPKGLKVSQVVAQAKAEYVDLSDDQITEVKRVAGKITSDSLARVWRRAHGRYVEGHQPELRVKDVGQLRAAYTRVGDLLPALILLSLQDWPRFTAHAKMEGAFDRPSKPAIGYFVRHVDAAASLALKLEAGGTAAVKTLAESKAGKAKTPNPVQIIAPTAPATKMVLTAADIEDALSDPDSAET